MSDFLISIEPLMSTIGNAIIILGAIFLLVRYCCLATLRFLAYLFSQPTWIWANKTAIILFKFLRNIERALKYVKQI